MANIDQYIEQIANARYGEEVRNAIVNALEAMNAEISGGGVTSFNSRTGAVTSANNDYDITQISANNGVEGQVPTINAQGRFVLATPTITSDLEDLSDVAIAEPVDGQVLKFDGVGWRNADVSGGGGATGQEVEAVYRMPTPKATYDGRVFLYMGSQNEYTRGAFYKCIRVEGVYNWVQVTASDISYLLGVEITNPTNGQVLKYDGTKWINADESSGGTSNYNDLSNKPSIGGITLTGNKTLNDLSIMPSNGVVANPSGTATVDLTKLQIGSTFYNIVNNKQLVASVTSDGVKTYKELLIELGSHLTRDLALTAREFMIVLKEYDHNNHASFDIKIFHESLRDVYDNRVWLAFYGYISVGNAIITIERIDICTDSSSWHFEYWSTYVASTSASTNSYDDTVPLATDRVLELYIV